MASARLVRLDASSRVPLPRDPARRRSAWFLSRSPHNEASLRLDRASGGIPTHGPRFGVAPAPGRGARGRGAPAPSVLPWVHVTTLAHKGVEDHGPSVAPD